MESLEDPGLLKSSMEEHEGHCGHVVVCCFVLLSVNYLLNCSALIRYRHEASAYVYVYVYAYVYVYIVFLFLGRRN